MAASIVPVILSGGSGTRLWPISRRSYPKQFWSLVTDKSLIQDTVLRASGAAFLPPMVVCNEEHRFLVRDQLHHVGIDDAEIVLEPVGRNSAPAIAAAALIASERDPDAVLWIMAADSAVALPDALQESLERAAAAARMGYCVTFGMQPSSPETGYGYIEVGEALEGLPGVFKLARFVEKPDAAAAAALVAGGQHLWNSGMFVATVRTWIKELEDHAPAVLEAVKKSVAGRRDDLGFIRLEETSFASSPDISIDYAVAERTRHAAVVPAEIGWSDVGSWDALWQIADKDADGNTTTGDVMLVDAKNCIVRADGMLVAVAGLEGIALVVTEDAVLAAPRERSQDVKIIVDRLKKQGRKQATEHNRIYRPWGFYESLISGARFQVKRIVVEPGKKLSLQKHFHRAEHWVVVAGTAAVTRDAEVLMVRENESIYLPLGCVHRLDNPGKIPLELIEVQSGAYLGEDDIVRLEDHFGRS